MSSWPLPAIVAHADWSNGTAGRVVAVAVLEGDGTYRASAAKAAVAATLIEDLTVSARGGTVLVGFDFPIGLPEGFVRRVDIIDFPSWLAGLDVATWDRFRSLASSPSEIDLGRPFYPHRPGGTSQAHLVAGHGVATMMDLMRTCDREAKAAPMFWTLGAKQCGRAALAGWHEVLRPAMHAGDQIAIWPFQGSLCELLSKGRHILVETYPALFYPEVGIKRPFGKRKQCDRQDVAQGIHAAARDVGLSAQPALAAAIDDGFGPRPDGENAFDAVVGLIGMLLVLRGRRSSETPSSPVVRNREGWMLGLDPETTRG